jgi:hypothetical protein
MGTWFYPSEYQFETNVPLLNYIPPITTDMPYEIMMSYVFLDSLMRNYPPALDTIIVRRWFEEKSKNDTVKAVIKYLYKLQDYDPVRFHCFAYTTGHAFIPYRKTLYALSSDIYRLLSAIQTLNNPSITALQDLLDADYVLKVHVNYIDTMPWPDHPNKFLYGVNATVIDTLKGRVYKNNCSQNMVKKGENDQFQTNGPCIKFSYATGPYSGRGSGHIIDQTLLNSTGKLTLQTGQDIVVTLSYGNHKIDYNNHYFALTVITAIPIINGQVKDGSHIWSDSTLLNYTDWKNSFNQRVNMLLNGGY